MIRRSTAFVLGILALTASSGAAELTPGSGYSLHLASFDGTVYYTVDEQGGYRVVATIGSGADGLPIRLVSTLEPGQRVSISVPQSVDRPAIVFDVLRDGNVLIVGDPISAGADAGEPVMVQSALKE